MPQRKISRRLLLGGAAVCWGASRVSAADAPRLLVCGGTEVYDARLGGTEAQPQWEDLRIWKPEQSQGLPASYASRPFRTTDDCKPVDGGKRVLVTSSANGVAIYERQSGRTEFYAMVPNAHSACTLPENHLVVAASVNAEGNALVLFRGDRNERPLFRTPLESAHGVVWDEKRDVLYAVGMDRLEEYSFAPGGSAPLKLLRHTPLPSRGGHELAPGRTDNELVVTTESEALFFDKEKRAFRPHPELGSLHHVKCISIHPQTGRTAYVKADEGQGVWWTFQIRFLNPSGEIKSPGQRVYKVRWG